MRRRPLGQRLDQRGQPHSNPPHVLPRPAPHPPLRPVGAAVRVKLHSNPSCLRSACLPCRLQTASKSLVKASLRESRGGRPGPPAWPLTNRPRASRKTCAAGNLPHRDVTNRSAIRIYLRSSAHTRDSNHGHRGSIARLPGNRSDHHNTEDCLLGNSPDRSTHPPGGRSDRRNSRDHSLCPSSPHRTKCRFAHLPRKARKILVCPSRRRHSRIGRVRCKTFGKVHQHDSLSSNPGCTRAGNSFVAQGICFYYPEQDSCPCNSLRSCCILKLLH